MWLVWGLVELIKFHVYVIALSIYAYSYVIFFENAIPSLSPPQTGTLENILINGISTALVRAQFILGSESFLGSKYLRF